MNVTDVSKPRKARRAQAERSESMQQRLLDAATAVLKERGLAGFRTAEVIKRAGVSKGALLHHFPTKVRLIAATFERLRGSTDGGAHLFRPRATLVEAVNDLIAESHAFFFGEAYYVSLDIAISGARATNLRDAVFNSVRGGRQRTEELWTERLATYGVSRKRALEAVWLVNGLIRGLAVRAFMETDHPWVQRLERIGGEMIVAHLSKPDGLHKRKGVASRP